MSIIPQRSWGCHAAPTYRRLHVSYFAVLSLIGAVALWALPEADGRNRRLKPEDAIFNAVSALSVTGLASVEMHRFSMPQLVLLLSLMIIGSQVFTSAIPLFIRRYASARSIRQSFPKLRPLTSLKDIEASVVPCSPDPPTAGAVAPLPPPIAPSITASSSKHVKRAASMPSLPVYRHRSAASSPAAPVPAPPAPQEKDDLLPHPPPSPSLAPSRLSALHSELDESPIAPFVSPFVEQEALAILCWLVVIYFIVAQILGFLLCFACIEGSRRTVDVLRQRRVNAAFFAFFITVSSFANAGFVPLDDNLVAMEREAALLLVLCALILAGNTMFAPGMRAAVWALKKAEEGEEWLRRRRRRGPERRRMKRAAALVYLLESPRRCFTHLFPRWETRWLVVTVVALNGVQMAVMAALEWRGAALEAASSPAGRLVVTFFSSVTTRNAGMNVVNIAAFSAPTLLLCLVMMYIAVYPVYLSRETSKESIRLVGDGSLMPHSKVQMTTQFRKLLAQDSLYLFIATFFICLTERHSIHNDPLNFSIFSILFEVISAYGNVGLSLGYSCSLQLSSRDTCVDVPYSFSGKWSTLGKLMISFVMLLGRHRGLPDDLDWAITLPSYD